MIRNRSLIGMWLPMVPPEVRKGLECLPLNPSRMYRLKTVTEERIILHWHFYSESVRDQRVHVRFEDFAVSVTTDVPNQYMQSVTQVWYPLQDRHLARRIRRRAVETQTWEKIVEFTNWLDQSKRERYFASFREIFEDSDYSLMVLPSPEITMPIRCHPLHRCPPPPT